MDAIIHAVDLARASELTSSLVASTARQDTTRQVAVDPPIRRVGLDPALLEEKRIVAHGSTAESRSFDLLRTQVLLEMDRNGWHFLAVTSPTGGCGKTTIACNLALSIARLADRKVMLVDLDLRKPSIAKRFGVKCDAGIVDVLEGQTPLFEALVNTTVESASLVLLPGKGSALHSSDLLASQSMVSLLQTIRREFRNRIVIFDSPSVLEGDDVISILPRVDATLLVASAGKSTIENVRECKRHLEQTPVVRVVLNKVPPSKAGGPGY